MYVDELVDISTKVAVFLFIKQVGFILTKKHTF